MFSIDGKLYGILVTIMNLVILDLLLIVTFIPIFTIPIGILFVCQGCINILQDKKFNYGFKFSKKIYIRLLSLTVLTVCSILTILTLFSPNNIFPGYILISIIISFLVVSYIMILLYSDNLLLLFKSAFYYTLIFFYKTVVPIFLLLIVFTHPLSFGMFMTMLVIPIIYLYVFIRINFNGISEIKWLTKNEELL
ncbi:MAG: hypothetical protein ACK5LY_04800 [Lachnospirales bacterium]